MKTRVANVKKETKRNATTHVAQITKELDDYATTNRMFDEYEEDMDYITNRINRFGYIRGVAL